ncbi:disintegrin and metalloproteinase domain-containing protein 12 isoform X1 [Onthophagus taurus]|uniref:disintegrin and metalloproteinase domain-containing protein 12 isoform X1 n=1 Tax=Onthophagus taurus TaxID=166361 RepID=UPI0039BE4CBC
MADVVVRVCYMLCLLLSTGYLDITIAHTEGKFKQHLDISTEQHPAPDFTRHTLIKPRIYHGREKRQISSTKEESGYHIQNLQIQYDLRGKDYTLDLQLNRDLIPKNFFHRVQENGKSVLKNLSEKDVELCHYNGKIRGVPDSFAALSTCDGRLTGVVYDGEDMHYVEGNGNGIEDYHYLYSHSDIDDQTNKTCGYKGDAHQEKMYDEHNRILRYKRETKTPIRGPYNANKQSRYIELILVVDNTLYKDLGENSGKVEKYCKDITNIINSLYAPLNIFIALVGVVTWNDGDEIDIASDGDVTLAHFLHYRREILMKSHPNDNAQLITKKTFNNGVVGKALKGPICTYEYSGAVNSKHSQLIGLVAATIAHEMGHNFGMEHDTNECRCPEERCIMAPSSSTIPPKHWSSCSLDYLALSFEHGMDYCLRNKPESLFGSPVCGNGFVESGEQCDCGLPDHCNNSCCNATTCMLNANASCATGECCDLNTCKPKKAGTLCRSNDIECDLPEYCTGQSEYCPDDNYKMDTEPCNNGKAYCYRGFCRTRSDQCKLLWGITGKSSADECYRQNSKGARDGNCGYNKLNQVYSKCQNEHVLCGMLHCVHLNERLEFGMESVAILSQSYININGSIVPCRTALVDLGLNQIDPGLAPDGAKCGDGKMCVNQKCLPVANLRAQGKTCPNDCNGNGVCNNLGHCHCKDGFAPPYCDYPGVGGSEDSGPASDPNAQTMFVKVVYIIFLVIVPILALIAFLAYYTRHNLKFTWSKTPSMSNKPVVKPRTPPYQQKTPKRSTEDNHSLLTEEPLKNDFFGHFNGFTISPKKTEPIRPAPPVPATPVAPPFKSPSFNRTSNVNKPIAHIVPHKPINTTAPNSLTTAVDVINATTIAPALPPLNPGSNPRPIISSPILENSTCTAKELISPLKNAAPKLPSRPAPEAPPPIKERPLSADVTPVVTFADEKKVLNGNALNRIASFLSKQTDKKPVIINNTNSLPRNKKIDKSTLRTLEISNPIPQSEIKAENALPAGENSKAVVMRAQSMRQTNSTRPAIPTFGSMRQTNGFKRPVSIPSGNRPKSPPPPRPPVPDLDDKNKNFIKIPGLPGYQEPCTDKKANQYDDCLNEAKNKSPSNDNIYAVIEESPTNTSCVTSPESKKSLGIPSNSGSNESFGLLGEIVSEIQNRNFDSIYSTSTLARKKKEQEEIDKLSKKDDTYVNTSSIYAKSPESVYSNMNNIKSCDSTSSSGYIHPSAINTPKIEKKIETKIEPKIETKPPMSTFKGDVKEEETKTKPTTTKTRLDRQPTPPNLRTRKPSPTRPPSSQSINKNTIKSTTPKPTSNSPDLVTSCSNKKPLGTKPPDVLNNSVKKPATIPIKPNLVSKGVSKVNKTVSLKTDVKPETKSVPKVTKTNSESIKSMPTGARLAAKQQSTVASLQQKFENKPPISAKTVASKSK